MSYIKKSLSTGEEIKYLFKHHWITKLAMVFWAIIAIPTLGLTLLLSIYSWLFYRTIEQGVTNKRLILKKGIISRSTEEMQIAAIESVEITQSVFGRILGYGMVKVIGRGDSEIKFEYVADPLAVKRKIGSVEIT
jgi:uncharacterized membrane protein YdbT with pleckstrin-like domain